MFNPITLLSHLLLSLRSAISAPMYALPVKQMLECRFAREERKEEEMKRLVTLACLFIVIVSCGGNNGSGTKELKQLLQNNKWGPDARMAGTTLKFMPNGTIETESNFEGGYILKATYDVKGQKVIMKISFEEEKYDPPKEIVFVVKDDNTSLKYSQCLVSISGSQYERKYWNQSSKSKEIGIIEIDGNRIIIDRSNAYMNDQTHFYQFPDDTKAMYSIYDADTQETSMTLSDDLLKYIPTIEIIGYLESNREWILALKPIAYGSYTEMKIIDDPDAPMVNYCWIKRSEVSF